MKITKPTLLLDKNRCLANIKKMLRKAQGNNITLRPHFKTHQSHEVGRWFRDLGIDKIAVSSLTMAAYFAQDNWKDIMVAIPTNILEIETINKLASTVRLNLLIQSLETLEFLDANLSAPIQGFIKIDLGYGRTGIQANDKETLDKLIQAMNDSQWIAFAGFIGHAGHSYDAQGLEQINRVHQEALAHMEIAYQHYHQQYPELQISMGDTPTCSTMPTFGCATEIRPGNFVFYDLVQEQIGSCKVDEIAVAVACPIVALHPERNEIIIYGGGVHFSKDVYQNNTYGKCYGLVVAHQEYGWGAPIPNVYLQRISQEHGVIKCTPEFMENCKVGDLLKILPVHSCMTADLLKRLLTTDGTTIAMMPSL